MYEKSWDHYAEEKELKLLKQNAAQIISTCSYEFRLNIL